MARGNDESNNPRRRPQRPQTDEEKMAIVKQVFPNAHEVITPHEPDIEEDEDEARALRLEKEYADMAASYYQTAQNDATKEYYGDDYNAYKMHMAGETDEYEKGQDPDDPYDKGKKKDPYDKE